MWPMQKSVQVTRCAAEVIRDHGQAVGVHPGNLVSDGGGSEVYTHDIADGGGTNVELDGRHCR